MPTVVETVVLNVCRRCGHKWQPRLEKARICPKCKRADWDQEGTMTAAQDAN